MIIRQEKPEDYEAIRVLLCTAFEGDGEARLVEALRDSAEYIPDLSLVAEEEGALMGHILLSRIEIETPRGAVPALALAPLSVSPKFQHQGIGTALTKAGIAACQSRPECCVVVLGNPAYYPKFGFESAAHYDIRAPWDVPVEAFMVLPIREGSLSGVSGIVRYSSAFDAAL